MSDIRRDAKIAALQHLKSKMGKQGGISAQVTAKNPKDLKAGLKKAAKIMEEKPEMFEGHEAEEHDWDDMSREELIELLKRK